MNLSTAYTLIDITQTNDRTSSDAKTRNQQRNFETVTQVLGLRTQLLSLSTPQISDVDITGSKFGSNYTGHHFVWAFTFGTEQEGVYALKDKLFGTLENDFTNVPIILGLSETVHISIPTFCTSGPATNIYFEQFKL